VVLVDTQTQRGTTMSTKTSAEGKEWRHSGPKFVQAKLKGECSYSHAQRLIGFAESEDPKAALAKYRKQDAAKQRDKRVASQTSENAAKKPAWQKVSRGKRCQWQKVSGTVSSHGKRCQEPFRSTGPVRWP
jgi:hypothetical protein